MKICCMADIHFHEFKDFSHKIMVKWDEIQGKYIPSSTGTNINSRLLDIANCLIEAREYCLKNDIFHLLISGDLFHSRGAISTVVYNTAYRVLQSIQDAGIQVTLIPGNHDLVDNTEKPENSLYGLKELVTVLDEPLALEYKNFIVLGVPYNSNKENVIKPIEDYIKNNPKPNKPIILMAHLGLSGAFIGATNFKASSAYTVEDLHPEYFDFVLLGDYHKPQVLPGSQNKMFYAGAPLQHNFNDEGEERGFVILDLETHARTLIPINSPHFITINPQEVNSVTDSNFYRLVGKDTEVKQSLLDLDTNVNIKVELQKETKQVHRSEISATMSWDKIIQQYAREQNKADYIAIGLEILKGVNQGGVN